MTLRGLEEAGLLDEDLAEEIELLTEVILAVMHAPHPLPMTAVDQILGLSPV